MRTKKGEREDIAGSENKGKGAALSSNTSQNGDTCSKSVTK